jgi:hypothetical protein
MNRKPLPEDKIAESPEIAQVRAEVARALSEQPPNVTLLTAALERVDALLAHARAELVTAVRDMQTVQGLQATGAAPESLTERLMRWG